MITYSLLLGFTDHKSLHTCVCTCVCVCVCVCDFISRTEPPCGKDTSFTLQGRTQTQTPATCQRSRKQYKAKLISKPVYITQETAFLGPGAREQKPRPWNIQKAHLRESAVTSLETTVDTREWKNRVRKALKSSLYLVESNPHDLSLTRYEMQPRLRLTGWSPGK